MILLCSCVVYVTICVVYITIAGVFRRVLPVGVLDTFAKR
jgi:hypothetical protein